MKKLIIVAILTIVLCIGIAHIASPPVRAAQVTAQTTNVVLFKWIQKGSGSTLLTDTSGYASGWHTVFWCTGGFNDVATITEYDNITTPPTPLYTARYHCDGGKHYHLEANSLSYESWSVTERLRDTTTLKAIGQCVVGSC